MSIKWSGRLNAAALGVVLSLIVASPIFAEVTVQQYQNTSDRDAAEVYIVGLALGATWSNGHIRAKGEQQFFCQPEKLGLIAQNYVSMLDAYIKETEPSPDTPIEYLMIRVLVHTFPC